jgi:hypothetical protein
LTAAHRAVIDAQGKESAPADTWAPEADVAGEAVPRTPLRSSAAPADFEPIDLLQSAGPAMANGSRR